MAGTKNRIIHNETVERALDLAISEHESKQSAAEANRRFIRSGVVIRDVLGTLTE